MTEAEIRKAKLGDRVKFVPLDGDDEYSEGTITIKLNKTIEVTWDDGSTCTYRGNVASCVRPL